MQPAENGGTHGTEGNPLVDRDENGVAVRIAETGYNFAEGPFPDNPTCEFIRWSSDGGRTWEDEVNLTVSGHLYSTVLDDGSVLTTYGNYIAGSPLIRWRPLR